MPESDRLGDTVGERDLLRPAPRGAPPVSSPGMNEHEEAARAILLSARDPRRVLERLSTGDPLRLFERGALRIRQRSLFIEPTRLQEQGLLRVALATGSLDRETAFSAWVGERIDEAIDDLLRQDRDALNSSPVPPRDREQHYEFLEEIYDVPPEMTLRAAVSFNGLPEPTRMAFFALLVDGRSVADCIEAGMGPAEVLKRNVTLALAALRPDIPIEGLVSASLGDAR